ncbi:MAG: RNA-guided endonuclease InsQ/TnpB family protein [Spirulina sp.]
MKRTVSIPVDLPHERFLPLMGFCAEIFNQHVDWALKERTWNKSKAHKDLYANLRLQYPEVPSALLQTIRDNAMEAVKATQFQRKPRKKPTSGLRYDKRTMTLRGRQLTLSCIGKRAKVILHVPEYFREVFETWKFCGGTLTYTQRTQKFWVRWGFETETPQHCRDKAGLVSTQGIDRGLYHLATTSDGQFFKSNQVRAAQRRYLHNRKTLQHKGTPSAKRRLKAMSGREKRFMRDVNHCATKKLARQEKYATFVLEDLSGIRAQKRGKKLNKWLSSWSFHQRVDWTWRMRFAVPRPQLEQFLSYKAEALGKRVVFVDARYTSQKCSRCGHIRKGNRKKSRFHCHHCGYKAHADVNAAVNVRDNHILSLARDESREQGSVNAPDASGFS